MVKKLFVIPLILPAIFAPQLFAQKKPVKKSGKAPAPVVRKYRLPPNWIIDKPKTVEPENWREYVSADDKFKIDFPKTPQTKIESAVVEDEISFDLVSTQAHINERFYLVNIRRFPKDFLPKRVDLSDDYASYLAGYLLSGEKILKVERLSYDGYSGYEFVYGQAPSALIVLRVYVVGTRLYQLMVFLENEDKLPLEKTLENNREKLDKFFNSFQITEFPVDMRQFG